MQWAAFRLFRRARPYINFENDDWGIAENDLLMNKVGLVDSILKMSVSFRLPNTALYRLKRQCDFMAPLVPGGHPRTRVVRHVFGSS